MKKTVSTSIIIAFLLVFFSHKTKGQQDPGFTQYMFNTQAVNAAYAGTQDAINILLLSRHQWVGFEGAPQTQTLGIHAPIDKKYVGLGFSYIRDRIGPLNVDNIYFDYSFKVKLHETGTLSMGLKTGLDMRSNNLTTLNPLEGADPAYVDIIGKLSFNFGAGFYYYTPNYYVGISMPKLRRTRYNEGNSVQLGEEFQERHLFLIGGYVFDIDSEWKLKPTVFTKYVKGAPASIDINLSTMFRERVVAGISHRIGDSFGLMTQLRAWDNLWIGYAYDFTITPLKSHNRGTHEIMLMFDLYTPKAEVVKSPRFF